MKVLDNIIKVVKENPSTAWYVVGVFAGGTAVGIVLNNRIKEQEESLEFYKTVADLQADMTVLVSQRGMKLCEENRKLKEEISELKKEKES